MTIDNLLKIFPSGVRAVDGVSLDVADGELMVIVGPSGSGKTTLLRLIAGLERPDAGETRFDGELINGLAPRKRDVAMAFQTPALYPHLSVRDNLSMSLRLRKTPRSVVRERVEAVATGLKLPALMQRRPAQLSGGERQRVALGRALVRQPRCALLDEPMAQLDVPLRQQLRLDLLAWHRQRPTTTLYVTHDQHEALLLGQRVVVMAAGKIQQCAAPLEIYERPANRFVAGFFGSPAMSFLDGRLTEQTGSLWFDSDAVRLRFPIATAERLRSRIGEAVVLGLRPEAVQPVETGAEVRDGVMFDATVTASDMLGDRVIHYLSAADGQQLAAQTGGRTQFAIGSMGRFQVDPTQMHFFAADSAGGTLL